MAGNRKRVCRGWLDRMVGQPSRHTLEPHDGLFYLVWGAVTLTLYLRGSDSHPFALHPQ